MESAETRQRKVAPDVNGAAPLPDLQPDEAQVQGKGPAMQLLRFLLFSTWFQGASVAAHATQLLAVPLYWIQRDYYYAWIALTKRAFGIIVTTITQWFTPTDVRISGDKSIPGQLRLTKKGRLITDFPERMVLIANHQVYTDWLYLWWMAYTSEKHGHIFIVLKDTLRYIPVIGPGMMFYGFIFMARKWEKDQKRMAHRLNQLKTQHEGPLSGSKGFDPMWLMLFPEANTRRKSAEWAEKSGNKDFKHVLLPRSTGLRFSLEQLKGTIDWVYDCTMYYEGVPRGGYAQDHLTLRSTYLAGKPPKSVNLHWRRYHMSSIPFDDQKEFEKWLMKIWQEKDELIDYFESHGHFPADKEAVAESSFTPKRTVTGNNPAILNTSVQLRSKLDLFQIYGVLLVFAVLASFGARLWNLYRHGTFSFEMPAILP